MAGASSPKDVGSSPTRTCAPASATAPAPATAGLRVRPAAGGVEGLVSRHGAADAPVSRRRVGLKRRVGIRAAPPAERGAASGRHTRHVGGRAVSRRARRHAARWHGGGGGGGGDGRPSRGEPRGGWGRTGAREGHARTGARPGGGVPCGGRRRVAVAALPPPCVSTRRQRRCGRAARPRSARCRVVGTRTTRVVGLSTSSRRPVGTCPPLPLPCPPSPAPPGVVYAPLVP